MALIDIVRVGVGQVAVLPGSVKMVATDSLATITTAGYLNNVGNQINSIALAPSDIIECLYNFDTVTKSGSFTFLAVSITNGVITLSATSGDDVLTNAHIFVGNAANVATDVAMTGDVAISNTGVTTIQAGSIDLAMLSAGITPSHVIKFADQVTTAGGAAAEAFTVTGAVGATDLAFVQVVDDGTANVTVLQAVVTDNTLTVTFSADPGSDCVINFQIIRAAA